MLGAATLRLVPCAALFASACASNPWPPIVTAEGPKADAIALVKLDFEWTRDEMEETDDFIMVADFTFNNGNDFAVKNLEVTCMHFANGKRIESNRKRVHERVEGKGGKQVGAVRMGLLHRHVTMIDCRITNLSVVN